MSEFGSQVVQHVGWKSGVGKLASVVIRMTGRLIASERDADAAPDGAGAAPAGHRNAFDRAGRRNVFAFISVVRLQVDKAFGAVFRTLRLHSRQLIVLDHIALAPGAASVRFVRYPAPLAADSFSPVLV
jgi:hypothetical protein